MREAVVAALGTLIVAAGVTGGTVALADTDPYVLDPPPPIIEPPPIPPPDPPLPPPPLVTTDDTTRREPERFTFQVQDSEPELDIQVSAVVETDSEVPAPSAPPADTGMGSNVEQWRPLVTTYFGAELVDIAMCLMALESGGNPGATNSSSGASGLMQVLPSWADDFGVSRDALYDPATNLSISRSLYDDGGWGHWSPWKRGACH